MRYLIRICVRVRIRDVCVCVADYALGSVEGDSPIS